MGQIIICIIFIGFAIETIYPDPEIQSKIIEEHQKVWDTKNNSSYVEQLSSSLHCCLTSKLKLDDISKDEPIPIKGCCVVLKKNICVYGDIYKEFCDHKYDSAVSSKN